MKKILLFAISAILIYGCSKDSPQNENNIYNSVYYANGIENYYYYDDILTEKPVVHFDTTQLRKEIEQIFPYENVYSNFGEGYNNFYFMLMIDRENKVSYRFLRAVGLSPEMGYIDSPSSVLILASHTNNKKWTNINLFSVAIPDTDKIFNTSQGKIDGKLVPSLKLYEISVILSKEGSIIQPWQIKETDFDKYRPKFVNMISRKDVGAKYYLPDYHFVDNSEKVKHKFARQKFEHEYRKKLIKSGNMKDPDLYLDDQMIWTRQTSSPMLLDGWGEFYQNLLSAADFNVDEASGCVITEIFIDKNGDVVGTQLLKGLNDKCDKLVLKTLKQTKFYSQDTLASFIIPVYFETADKKKDIDLCLEFVKPELISKENREFQVGDEINFHYKIINKAKSKLMYNEMSIEIIINGKHCGSINGGFIEFKETENWFYWKIKNKGKYNYAVYIDPDNLIGDKDLKNNIIKGTFEVK